MGGPVGVKISKVQLGSELLSLVNIMSKFQQFLKGWHSLGTAITGCAVLVLVLVLVVLVLSHPSLAIKW